MLEKLAAQWPDLPFAVRPTWPALDWVKHGEEMADFADMVAQVTAVLGKPFQCNAEHWISPGDSAPDLVARWRVPWPGKSCQWVELTARMISPKNCKTWGQYIEGEGLELGDDCKKQMAEIGGSCDA
jgi:hypothetical protein